MRGVVGQTVAPLWRSGRRLKNALLNRIDAPLIVLAYHRITRLTNDPHQLAVTPEHFQEQMAYLRDHCRCVRFDGDWSALREPAVAVTFDDGYVDNLHQALPILAANGIPATFFICTGNLDSGTPFWSDELANLVLTAADNAPDFILHDRGFGGCWPAHDAVQRADLHTRLHRSMLQVEATRRDEWLGQLRRWRGAERLSCADDRPLTRAELRHLAASPLVSIGAHGLTHTPLAILPADEQLREMTASKHELETLLHREVAVFSYPFGGRWQFDRQTLRLCRQAGFVRAVTTFPGQVHRWTDPLRLPRQLVRDWDAATFANKLAGFWSG